MNSPSKLLITSLMLLFSVLMLGFLSIQFLNPNSFTKLLSYITEEQNSKLPVYRGQVSKNKPISDTNQNVFELELQQNKFRNEYKSNAPKAVSSFTENSYLSKNLLAGNNLNPSHPNNWNYQQQPNDGYQTVSKSRKKRPNSKDVLNRNIASNLELNPSDLKRLLNANRKMLLENSDMNILSNTNNREELPIAPNDPGVPVGEGVIGLIVFALLYVILKNTTSLKLGKSIYIVTFLLISVKSFADGTFTVGANGNYVTLSSAISDLNDGQITGNIVLQITSDISETDSITINSSGTGACSYSSIRIEPTGGKRNITSSVAGYMLVLDGADYVTIDGINTAGDSLNLISIATGANTGVLKFKNDATNNTVTNCSIKSNSTESSTGLVMFGLGASSGNNGNTISNCNIGPYDQNLPLVGIYSVGLSSSAVNSNTIQNCRIHDIASPTAGAKIGIHLYDNNRDWEIVDNSFYFTDTVSLADESNLYMILIESAQGSTISGNYMGGSEPLCAGNPALLTGKITRFYGILGSTRMSGLADADLVSISNNTIQNIRIESVSTSVGNSENPRFAGIKLEKGRVEIRNNLIGSNTTEASIDILNNSSSTCYVIGIYSGYSNNGTNYQAERIINNQISGIRMSATSNKAYYFKGIVIYQKANQLENLSNNTIGSSSLANSIQILSGAMGSYGLFCNIWNISDSVKIKNNRVSNFAINQKSGFNSSFYGYYFSNNYCTAGVEVDSCVFVNLDAKTNSAGNVSVTGMKTNDYEYGSTSLNHFSMNNIQSISHITGMSLDGAISVKNSIIKNLNGNGLYGMDYYAYGFNSERFYNPEIANNLIVLGENNANDISIQGLSFYLDDMMMYIMNDFVVDFYHNSFVVTGSSSGRRNNTFAAQNNGYGYSSQSIMEANFTNNLFYNDRSSTGDVSTKYFGLYSYSYNNTLNYASNLYFSENGVAINNNGTNYSSTPISGEGGHSNCVIVDPEFSDLTSADLDDFRPTIDLDGDSISAFDLTNEARTEFYTLGALQQIADYYWNATATDDYETDTNWTDSKIARNNSNLIVQSVADKNLALDQNRIFKKIDFGSNSHRVKIELGNYDLTVDSISNPSTDNYIKVMGNGKLNIRIPAGKTKLFPIGINAYSPVTITNNTGSESVFSISLLDSVTNDGARTGQLLSNFRVKKTILLSSTGANSGDGYTLKLDWNPNDASNVNNPQFFEYNESLGTWKKTSGTTASSTNSATLTGYTGSATKFFVGSLEELNWDGSAYNGNPSAPDFFTNLTVDGDNLTTSGIVANNLTVNAGRKISHTSGTDKILGDFVLKSTDNAGNAQLLATSATTVAGQTILEKTFSGGKWYFLSLPFEVSANRIFKVVNGIETQASWGDAFEGAYVAGRDLYVAEYDTYNRDLQSSGSPNLDGAGLYWKNIDSQTIEANKGYIVALDGNDPLTFRFKSAVNAASVNALGVNKTIDKSATSAQSVNHSWNLVGNPYLSGFDLKDATNHKPYYLYDGSTYKTILGDLSDEDAERQMQSFTAFFCQAFDASSTVNFNASGKLFKAPSIVESPDYQIIKLGLSEINSGKVQDAVRFRVGSQFADTYILGEDAVKMASMDASVPQIYTNYQGLDLSVNSLSEIRRELNLKMYIPSNGRYKVELLLADYAKEVGKMEILDKHDNSIHSLSEINPLTFEATKGISDRFTLLLAPKDITEMNNSAENELKISVYSNLLLIDGLKEPSHIVVTDLNGKTIYSESNVSGEKNFRIENESVVILKIRNNSQQLVRKINLL